MPQILIVVNNPARWPFAIANAQVVAARAYLADSAYSTSRNVRVYNLSRSYRYQSTGYYVSLLAEARGHRPLPSISTVQDIKTPSLVRLASGELQDLIQKSLHHLQSDTFTLSIYFARNLARHYDRLSRALFNMFPAPLLRADFKREEEGWALQSINPIPTSEIPASHHDSVVQFANEFFAGRKPARPRKAPPRYNLAILYDPKEVNTPSDPRAINRFIRAAEAANIATELIGREDFGRISQFDALFIRETTAVTNHTFRFARRAEAEGLVVIDDPLSILRCTNKVFLAELLARYHILTPKTLIVHRDNIAEAVESFTFPVVLKQPDSSFSLGVSKVNSPEEYFETVQRLLEKSELIIAQEFLPTAFDWRIGVLAGCPLYACKYFMARKHWQIYDHSAGRNGTGRCETLTLDAVPERVMTAAVKAARLIGDGLYGVDLKEINNRPYIIEVNDNPSIDAGIEDEVLGNELYATIINHFVSRLDQRTENRNPPT